MYRDNILKLPDFLENDIFETFMPSSQVNGVGDNSLIFKDEMIFNQISPFARAAVCRNLWEPSPSQEFRETSVRTLNQDASRSVTEEVTNFEAIMDIVSDGIGAKR